MLYKFCAPTRHSLGNLRRQQLICRHYGDFNDPFEFWALVVQGVLTPFEYERFQAAMAGWGFPDITNAEPQEEYFDSLAGAEPAFPELLITRVSPVSRLTVDRF
jgi:hypothetical protein